jgi:hypothetical protein
MTRELGRDWTRYFRIRHAEKVYSHNRTIDKWVRMIQPAFICYDHSIMSCEVDVEVDEFPSSLSNTQRPVSVSVDTSSSLIEHSSIPNKIPQSMLPAFLAI